MNSAAIVVKEPLCKLGPYSRQIQKIPLSSSAHLNCIISIKIVFKIKRAAALQAFVLKCDDVAVRECTMK